MLLKMGRKGNAKMVLEDVEHRMKRLDRQQRGADATMYDWAIRELSSLRG